ncbi:Tryptophanyl-tRNA synthetase [Wickerhamomyces ciferrii]|uniref:Tryptophan--tRNA ligase, mitochondrial n=1 Tax=Wickerhamomyces ciferrii (strain ATCC 14091 / BCRC 22168 / CBS 111 / JCM 3599 / NBRC 0793 / NRRL Y-1031 F-60-10) TaxID=1206466 RepID=K0KR86_WICCF|nr:Tryptophanyl-tRNA synthetase [Wickerhamomyces ciferrii]CCH43813.1 Tryptophanyl-tRNA synthetase [Wickerhamomyces ciferrii]
MKPQASIMAHAARNLGQIRLNSTVKTTSYDPRKQEIPEHSTLFSMIQPTGMFHLGNYLGAVRAWKDLTDYAPDSTKLIFGTADLHAITIPKPAKDIRKFRSEAIASILASGVNHERAIIYHQSALPEHAELNWILSTLAGTGYLNRMTQWKSKSEGLDNSSLGLFAYPVLQAADILLFKSTHVPVGDDQVQHLELCRTLAESFNKQFGKTFKLPTTLLAPTKKILSLRDPLKKMSKSDKDQNATIYINETSDEIAKKIKKAVTDSTSTHFNYDPENRPGVSNLINIISGIQRKSIQEVESDISDFKDHKTFKDYVCYVINEEINEPRRKFEELVQNSNYLNKIVQEGNEKARAIASVNIKEFKQKVGF